MSWQWSPSVIAELVASAVLLVLAIYFPRRDINRQARLTGVTLTFGCALWMLSHAFEIGLPAISYKEPLVGIQLVLGIISITFWLFYILHYLGPRKLLTWRLCSLFGIMPLIALLALSTNNVHGLLWTGIGLDGQNPYLPLQPTYGPVYWVCMAYAAMLTLTGSFLIVWNIVRRRYGFNREAMCLLVAAVLPLVTALVEVTGLLSSSRIPVGLTPWAACIGALILILNLPQFHLEQVVPVARDITFERMGDCILVLDMQNRVLDLNPAAEQMIGYKISDAFGLSMERLWPHHPDRTMPFNEMLKSGEELVLERDGEQRAYSPSISTISDSRDHLTSQVLLLTDITERKRSEAALRQANEYLDNLFDRASAPIIVWDPQFRITRFNQAFERLAGRTASTMIGQSFEILFPPPQVQSSMALIQQTVSGERWEAVEIPILRSDGTVRTVLWNSATVFAADGKTPVATIAQGQDITERRKAEEQLKESNVRLQATLQGTLEVIQQMTEARDPYTSGHQRRVAELSVAIARQMGLPEESCVSLIRTAALIHDIGKMVVPAEILSKPGRLSQAEFALIKTHPQAGHDILKEAQLPYPVSEIVLQHHERYDGTGYPAGLSGDEILPEASIVAVADVVEAMSSHRPYRAALGIEAAMSEIAAGSGTRYYPDVVAACTAVFRENGFTFSN
jgi:PAS domain S-box-containing protein/putative nucleotidyltransferase with HDIG domain